MIHETDVPGSQLIDHHKILHLLVWDDGCHFGGLVFGEITAGTDLLQGFIELLLRSADKQIATAALGCALGEGSCLRMIELLRHRLGGFLALLIFFLGIGVGLDALLMIYCCVKISGKLLGKLGTELPQVFAAKYHIIPAERFGGGYSLLSPVVTWCHDCPRG